MDEYEKNDRALNDAKTNYMKEHGAPLVEKPSFGASCGKALGYFLTLAVTIAIVMVIVKLLSMLYLWLF